jgi:hypothetical protein
MDSSTITSYAVPGQLAIGLESGAVRRDQTMASCSKKTIFGAYGLRLLGVESASELLTPVASSAPTFALASELGKGTSRYERLSDKRAELRLHSGGRIYIDREAGTVLFRVPHTVRADELVHPYLAPAAAVIARWHGHESIHAGAAIVGGAAWALVGDRESGKSSTLAWLAAHGHDLACDDMLVLDGLRVLPGPRSIDLRADAAERLGVGEPVGVTGARRRWRVKLAPLRAEPQLAGWVFLGWGDRLELRHMGPGLRLARLLDHRGVRLEPARAESFVDYAALPAWELLRPRDWKSMEGAGALLTDLMAT